MGKEQIISSFLPSKYLSGTYVANVVNIAATRNFFQIHQPVSTGNWGKIGGARKIRRHLPDHHRALLHAFIFSFSQNRANLDRINFVLSNFKDFQRLPDRLIFELLYSSSFTLKCLVFYSVARVNKVQNQILQFPINCFHLSMKSNIIAVLGSKRIKYYFQNYNNKNICQFSTMKVLCCMIILYLETTIVLNIFVTENYS